MTRLRLLVLTVATLLIGALGVTAMPAAQACACGGFVAADGEEIAASAEYAALAWDGETERVLLSMDALTEATDAALLIPTPTPAEAELADTTVFEELDKLREPEEVVEYQWWPDFGFGGAGAVDGAPESTGEPVEVLDVRQLGDIEVTALAASEADALAEWLDEHDYVMRDNLADSLMPYISEGWYYLAIRLTTDADSLAGPLQPLDLTFASEQLIYPMRLSAAATDSQFVRTYVFGEHKVRRTDETATGAIDLRFAGEVSTSQVTSEALVSIISEQPYLTVQDQFFRNPAEEIVSDFTFAQAADDTPFREVVYVTKMREILGLPAGPVLTLLGLVVVGVGTATIGALSRRRRRLRRTSATG